LPYVERGFLTPITSYLFKPNPYIPGNKRWIDSLPKGFLQPFVGVDGQYYGMGADTAAIWVYYNPEHLSSIGMEEPTTWAQMIEACSKLKAKGIIPYSQASGLGWPITWWFVFTESSLWASEFPPNTSLDLASWVRAVKKGLLKKTDARTREAWQIMKEFGQYWQRGAVAGVGTKLYQDFANGKVTFMQDGSWQISTLSNLIKKRFPLRALKVGIPPITKATSQFANGSLQDSGVGALNGIAIWVTKHAKDHLDLVADFLAYYSSPQVMGPMAAEVGEVPMVSGVGTLPPLIAQAKDVAAQPMLLSVPYYSASVTYTTQYDKLAQGYLAGALSLDTALTQLESVQQATVDHLAGLMKL
jgi:ABC-type glycerol-3-phosphate transport system substrate-binding protein